MKKWYYIVTTPDRLELCIAVNEMIDEGFEPIGGMIEDKDGLFCQAMAKPFDPSKTSAALEYDKYAQELFDSEEDYDNDNFNQ
jgi:hypothetical protein